MKRWTVTIKYKGYTGEQFDEHQIDEMDELQNIVERAADWRIIIDIKIVYNYSFGVTHELR